MLSMLSKTIINRRLLKIKSVEKKDMSNQLKKIKKLAMNKLNINAKDVGYLVFSISIKNNIYNFIENEIKFLKQNHLLINLSEIKKEFNINTKNSRIIKHYICFPKECVN